jgi:hypothetical protein
MFVLSTVGRLLLRCTTFGNQQSRSLSRLAATPIKAEGSAIPDQEGRSMLPDASHPVWELIATGKRPLESHKPTVNLLIHSNKMSYERDQSPANVQHMAAKTHSFFSHFEALFPAEIAQILR